MFIDIPEGSLKREIVIDIHTMETAEVSGIVESFAIGRYPVTNDQFYNFIFDTDYSPVDILSYSHQFYLAHWEEHGHPPSGMLDHPVTFVSHDDAAAYAEYVGGRLPTYDEWLYAAYSETVFQYPWGEEYSAGKCNVRESGIGNTTPVGYFSPGGDSPFGCADMIGNVWEWTSTSVGEDLFLAVGTGWDHYLRQTVIPLDNTYRNRSVGFRVVRDCDI